MMNSVVIAASVRLTQLKMFCDLVKRMLGIDFFVEVNHLTPECSILGETNTLCGMYQNRAHLVGFLRNKPNITANEPQRYFIVPVLQVAHYYIQTSKNPHFKINQK